MACAQAWAVRMIRGSVRPAVALPFPAAAEAPDDPLSVPAGYGFPTACTIPRHLFLYKCKIVCEGTRDDIPSDDGRLDRNAAVRGLTTEPGAAPARPGPGPGGSDGIRGR